MLTNNFKTVIWILSTCALLCHDVYGRTAHDRSRNDVISWDASQCALYHKLCSHLDDHFALLSCTLNSSYNKTQIPSVCQQQLWERLTDLIDNNFLFTKLKTVCQTDMLISNCLGPTDYTIDCLLKRKPSATDKNCLRLINKIESLLFNDWQITENFITKCFNDIKSHTCGRIPPDSKSLSQTETLKCLQTFEQTVTPECQSEMTGLNEIKYTTLQLDKIVFAACNIEQKSFCPDEISGSWLMYKCLLRHKYENGEWFFFFIFLQTDCNLNKGYGSL